MKSSWKTTASGIIAILVAVLSAANTMLDNNPQTNPDWATVASAVMAGLGLIFARDNKVTSEDVGAK